MDVHWRGGPVSSDRYNVNCLLPKKDCTYFKSFVKNNEVYILGEYALVKVEKRNVIGRLICFYESHEDYDEFEKYRAIVRVYKKPEELDLCDEDKLLKNEIVEDNIEEDIFLEDVKRKCNVILASLDDSLDDNPNTYFLRYKISENSSLVPLLSDEGLHTSNCLNQFDKICTPRRGISQFQVLTNSPSGIPFIKLHSSMKKTELSAKKPRNPDGKYSAVKRNLNDSFSGTPNSQDAGTPVLNYSVVENTINCEEESIKMKFRVSQNQTLVVPLKKLDDNILNVYLNNDEKREVRRSTRPRVRLSYADYLTPTKRGRKTSVDSDSLTPLKDTTPSSKRRQTTSEGTPKKLQKTVESMDIDSPPKRLVKTPSKYSDYVPCPSTLPKKSILKQNTKTNTPRKSVCYRKDNDDDDSNFRARRKISVESSDDIKTPTKKRTSLRTPRKSIHRITDSDSEDSSIKTPTRRTPRRKISVDSSDDVKTPTKKRTTSLRTPKKSIHRITDSDSEDSPIKTPTKKRATSVARTPRKTSVSEDMVPVTPKTPRQVAGAVTPKSVKNTPSVRAKLIREGLITPSVQHRATPVKAERTPLNKAKTKLHVSYVPKALACREREFNDVYNFIEGKLLDGCGGCMYVSGVPGTGKTATVTEVIRKLQALGKSSKVPDFEYVSINGMKLSEPRQSYVEILRQLNGKTVRWEQAQSTLDAKFTKTGHKNKPIVLLVDELDILCTKRQDVVYNLLDWPTKAKAQLIVITIANTMDLPERLLMGRVTSRLGLTRLTFQAYTHKQLQEIVTNRLVGTNAFNPDAVQLVARKVASVSGDARRALDICRRSAEIAELEGDNTLVSMKHVNEALNAMITQPKVRAIKHCTRLQQLILQAVVAEVERTGVEETTFADVYTMLISVAALDGFQMVSCTVALGAVSRLGACRLLLTEPTANDFNQKLILNVSSDDVFYALRKD